MIFSVSKQIREARHAFARIDSKACTRCAAECAEIMHRSVVDKCMRAEELCVRLDGDHASRVDCVAPARRAAERPNWHDATVVHNRDARRLASHPMPNVQAFGAE